MKKQNKIIISIIVGLVVVIGIFAMTKITDLELLSGSITNASPSGTVCRKVSNYLYKNDLYTDTLSELNVTWESANKCGKRFPSLFKKSLKMNADEDKCSMFRDWLDEGVLTSTATAFRINYTIFTQCAGQFRDVWFDESGMPSDGGSGNVDTTSVSAESCRIYHDWFRQGVLTSNFQSQNLNFNLAIDCSKYYPDIWYNEDKCMTLKFWHDYQGDTKLSQLMPLHNPPFATQDILDCMQQYGGSGWWFTNFKSDTTVQSQPIPTPSCETVQSWVKQGTSTANLQNLGLDTKSIITNCGNTCLLRLPVGNNEKCNTFALWLQQGTLTPNLQKNNLDWSSLTDCGYFCLFNY